MRNKNIDFFQKAQAYAFLLLKFRLRSEKEIRQRLKRKKFDDDVIEKTLYFLKDRGFIDDEKFAKSWLESRIQRPLGLERLRQELKIKGITQEIIEEEILKLKENYSESQVVSSLAKARFKKIKGIDRNKAKERIFRYLIRRGFSSDTIIDTIRAL